MLSAQLDFLETISLTYLRSLEVKYPPVFVIMRSWFIKPLHPDPGRRKKINLNFYFDTSLWCLKRFYEGLNDLHKTF